MNDLPPVPEEGELPRAIARTPGPRTLQLVWIIPVVAALIGGGIFLKTVLERGATINIRFESAEGIEAGKTKIKHKAVDVGTVRAVRLSPDHKSVVVTAEMDPQARDFLVQDTRFWVVRPRIAGGEISGLSTLLAGVYIGADPGTSQESRRDFEGLESPPVVTSDTPGRAFNLTATDLGSLDVNSPVYYRGILAGRVASAEVSPDGGQVKVAVFIHAPYDKYVNTQTRWWNASGLDFSLGAGGVKLETQSLVTLLLGGISFETPADEPAGQPVQAQTQFTLYDSRGDAFKPRETDIEHYVMKFTQSVRGLAVGSTVDFRGVTVGRVTRIDLDFDQQAVSFRSAVQMDFYPLRMRPTNAKAGGRWDTTPGRQRMKNFVEHGLRAQLRDANLLTGQLYIEIDFLKNQPQMTLDLAANPPEIPTVAGGLGELQESIERIAKNLEKVPFDQIGKDLRQAIADLHTSLGKIDTLTQHIDRDLTPEMRKAIEQARQTMSAAEAVLSTDSPVQGDLRETLEQVNRAADSLRALTDYLERHPESLIRGRRGDAK
jgi:paraquat-inducible protein B